MKKTAFILMLILLLCPLSAFCYQKTMTLTDREIIERLTRLEEGQKAIQKEQRLLREEMNKRFEEMNRRFEERFEAIDRRFEEMNRRFEERFEAIDRRFEEMNRRFEERFDEMNKRFKERFDAVDKRFDEMDKRITDLVHTANTMMVVFGGLVVAMMGLVFWDRRTLIEKAKDVTVRHIETDSRLIKVLRELSKTDKKLAEVMKTFGLL